MLITSKEILSGDRIRNVIGNKIASGFLEPVCNICCFSCYRCSSDLSYFFFFFINIDKIKGSLSYGAEE